MDWIDVSVPLRNDVIGWPGDVPVEVARRMRIEQGADYNISMITLSTHAGTHMDAPLHFIATGDSIDSMPVDVTVGEARIIEIRDRESIKRAELEEHDIQAGERIIFKTANSERDWLDVPMIEDYVHIATDASRFLVEHGVRCVGIDYLSVGSFRPEEAGETHTILLAGGVWIIECLYLVGVPAGPCELLCLPLRIEDSEGAPARAFIRPIGQDSS